MQQKKSFDSHVGFVLLFVSDSNKSADFNSLIFNTWPIENSATFALVALANGVLRGLWPQKTAEPIS